MSVNEQRLDSYSWNVRKSLKVVPGTEPDAPPQGVTEETLLVFESDDGRHRVVIGLDDANRRELARGLTHGVIVA